jgi:hypothetical protein
VFEINTVVRIVATGFRRFSVSVNFFAARFVNYRMRTLILSSVLFALAIVPAFAADLTGTWIGSVDLENGQHGDPVFVLKQTDGKLAGTYTGPFGEQKVTGNVNGDVLTLQVSASADGGSVTLSYKGKLEGGKLSGTMTRNINGDSTPGKWTATKK